MTIEQLKNAQNQMEKELADLEEFLQTNIIDARMTKFYKELKFKMMGGICAYEYLIKEAT